MRKRTAHDNYQKTATEMCERLHSKEKRVCRECNTRRKKKLWKYLHKNRWKQTQYLRKKPHFAVYITHHIHIHQKFKNILAFGFLCKVWCVKEAAERREENTNKKKTMFIQFCYISPSSHQMAERKVHSLAYAIILRFSLANNQSANWRVTKLTLHTWSHHVQLPSFEYDNLWIESNSRECVSKREQEMSET